MNCCSKRRYERIIHIFLKVREKEGRVTDFQVRAQVEISSKLSKKHTLQVSKRRCDSLFSALQTRCTVHYLACCAY